MGLNSTVSNNVKVSLAARESSNNQYAVNDYNYIGTYQMGTGSLEDSGYIEKGTYADARGSNQALKESDNWTGKDGIKSQQDFLNSREAQESAMDSYMAQNYRTGVRSGVLTANSSQQEIAAYTAAAHLKGAGGANNYWRGGNEPPDGFGTEISEYVNIGYDAGQAGVDGTKFSPVTDAGQYAISGGATTTFKGSVNGVASNSSQALTGNQTAQPPERTTISNEDGVKIGERHRHLDTQGGKKETVFEAPWAPRPNSFQKFATMTYSVSLYLMSKDQYSKMMIEGVKSVRDLTVFIQSGGINNSSAKANHGAKRSDYFKNDYYLDDIQFKSLISGTSQAAPHNTFELNFTITEPAGLTFFENLNGMVRDKFPDETNYVAQHYLMVVRFYGYDENGNQVMGHEIDGSQELLSDSASVGEKYIPFIFTGITFRLTDNKVEYQCSAVCPQSLVPKDRVHATIQADVTLQGRSLKEVLGEGYGGRTNVTTEYVRETDAKGKVTEKKVTNETGGTRGLTEILNRHAKEVAENYGDHDEYVVEFEKGYGFEEATVLAGGTKYLATAGMLIDDKDQSIRFDNGKIRVLDSKKLQVMRGTKIVKLIDVIMQTSSYITSQYLNQTDPNSGTTSQDPKLKKDFVWYKIRTQVTPIKWSEWRNDFTYEIKYVISPYKFTSESEYAKKMLQECFSVHKEYDYWFTGNNTEVLNFHQDYNYLYYTSMSQEYDNDESANKIENNLRTVQRRYHEYNSQGTSQMGVNDSTEISSNVASTLYSPADQAQARIEIVGDPDFIGQSELFYSPTQNVNSDFAGTPFMVDGSVNYDASEIYFVINYNTVVDYNLANGLADVTKDNLGRDIATGQAGLSNHSLMYRANIITSKLQGGKFTQILEGTMKDIPQGCTFTAKLPDMARREPSNKKETTAQRAGLNKNSDAIQSKNTVLNEIQLVKPSDENIKKSVQNQPWLRGGDEALVRDPFSTTMNSINSLSTTFEGPPEIINPAVDSIKNLAPVKTVINQAGRITNAVDSFSKVVFNDLDDAVRKINNPLDDD